MENKKLKRILAIVALVFMFIFTVTFVIVLISPKLCNGAFGYIALISFLLGAGFFIIVKYVLKDKQQPEYLPDGVPEDEEDNAGEIENGGAEDGQEDDPTENEALTQESESEIQD